MNTNVITIPRTMALRDDLIVLSRKDYECLLASRHRMEDLDDAISEGLQEYNKGAYKGPFTLDEAKAFLHTR